MCYLSTRTCVPGGVEVTETLSWGDLQAKRHEHVNRGRGRLTKLRHGGSKAFKSGEAPRFVRLVWNSDTMSYQEVTESSSEEDFIPYTWSGNDAVDVAHSSDGAEGRDQRGRR